MASAVKDEFDKVDGKQNIIRFLKDLSYADAQLSLLSKGMNPNYNRRRMGEAYALIYHMRHVFEVCTALAAIQKKYPFPVWPRVKVLDVGSGTGSVPMALAYWMLREHWIKGDQTKVEVCCIEPSLPMRETAARILSRCCSASEIGDTRYSWNHSLAHDLESASKKRVRDDEKFHVVFFSYVFSSHPERMAETVRQVGHIVHQLLRPGGIALFVSPNPRNPDREVAKKKEFIDRLTIRLRDGRFRRLELDIYDRVVHDDRRRKFQAPQSPEPIIRARNFFNTQCAEVGLDAIYDDHERLRYGIFCHYAALISP